MLILLGQFTYIKFNAFVFAFRGGKVVAVAAMMRDPVASQVAEVFYSNKEITKTAVIE